MSNLPAALSARLDAGHPHLHVRDLPLLGLGRSDLRRWHREGHLEPVGHGGYVIVTPPDAAAHPAAQERERMRRRTVAVLDTLPGAHACAASAALIHRLPLLAVPGGVEVASRPAKRTGRPGLSARPAWGHDPVRRDGVLVQTMADTVIEVAGRHGCETGLVVADAALHGGLDAAALDESLDLYDHRVGVAAARTVVALADARIESPGESRVRWVCHTAGIALEPQFPLRDEWGHVFARGDFRVAGTNVLVEFDGLLKYSDPADLRAEKMRQLRLERLGYRVVRLTWRDLDRPGLVIAMIREAISRAA